MSSAQWFLTGSVIVAFAYLTLASIWSVASALRAGGRREDQADAYEAVAASHLTMPVSIVVPARPSEPIAPAIENLLAMSYPEFEVIVVSDGPCDLESIAGEWQLEAREFFYRRSLDTASVRRILRSQRDSRLMVVEKEADQRSDAVNCGVNLARYRFVAVVPPAVTFDRTALLRAMAPALRDPVSIVGIGSHVERMSAVGRAASREARFQRLRSIRSMMFTRLFCGRLRHGLGPADGIAIWRRDAVLQANGFSRAAADADLDMMFRLQQNLGGEVRRFVRNEEPFGQVAAASASDTQSGVAQRQRAALQAITTWGPAASRSVGFPTFAYFLGSELITPAAQFWVIAATVAGAAAGWFTWTTASLAILLLSFGTAVVTAAALLMRGAHPDAPDRAELRGLLTLAPLEVLSYSSRLIRARLTGTFGSTAGSARG